MTTIKDKLCFGAVCTALVVSQFVAVSPDAVAAAGPVKIGTKVVFTNNVGDTQAIQENLDNALVGTDNPSPSSVQVVTAKSGSVITLGGYKVVTVDQAKAKAANTTAPVLAKRWADALRREL